MAYQKIKIVFVKYVPKIMHFISVEKSLVFYFK
jgi:hypothetical protein